MPRHRHLTSVLLACCLAGLPAAAGCNPKEAITDTYGAAIKKIVPDANKSDDKFNQNAANLKAVGKIILTVTTTKLNGGSTANTATVAAIVADQQGSAIADRTKVVFTISDNGNEPGAVLLTAEASTSSGSASFSFTCGFAGGNSRNPCAAGSLASGQTARFVASAAAGDATARQEFVISG